MISDAPSDPRIGLIVTHRRYVGHSEAHYGGGLVEGAYALTLFGDVATELSIRLDGDEGLLAGYESVTFLGPMLAGDVVEASAVVRAVGRRSRLLEFECRVVCRAAPSRGPSAADLLDDSLVITRAVGTVVAPATSHAP